MAIDELEVQRLLAIGAPGWALIFVPAKYCTILPAKIFLSSRSSLGMVLDSLFLDAKSRINGRRRTPNFPSLSSINIIAEEEAHHSCLNNRGGTLGILTQQGAK